MKKLYLLLVCAVTLFADQTDYIKGMEYYKNKAYTKAFPIIFDEAQNDNRAAQYRLAEMYENGHGTPVDHEQAMYWYKLASTRYAYIEEDKVEDKNTSYLSHIGRQFGNESIERGNEYLLAKMDTDTPETRTLVKSVSDEGFFGLQPYQTNFFLPLSYGWEKPPRASASIHPNNIPAGEEGRFVHDENTEVEFQFSVKKQLSYDLFGCNEYVYFGYTQKVWWQLYSPSAPFRETNYLPEVFVSIPTSQRIDNASGLKAVKFGFVHESNGQEGYRSRSWNRLYMTGMWQWGNLFMATRAWYRLDEGEKPDGYYEGLLGVDGANESGDDNPDIHNYLGYGDIKIDYLYKKSKFGFLLRNNLRFNGENKGAIEFNYSVPFLDSPNTFWYMKFFHGYGESLIDYNREVTKIAFGFSFSRGLF